MEEQIIKIIKETGPTLPVTISKKIQRDNFFTSAILTSLTKKNLIKHTHTRIGSSPIYYSQEHEQIAKKMIYERLNEQEKKLIYKISQTRNLNQKNLTPQERFLLRNLKDFINIKNTSEGVIIESQINIKEKTNTLKNTEQKETINQEQKINQPRKEIEKQSKLKTIKKFNTKSDEFLTRIQKFLDEKKVKILEHELIRKNTEHNFTILTQTNISTQKYFLKSYKKKTITEKDLTQTWFESQKKGMPIILLTTGKINKKAEQLLNKELKNQIQILKL